MTLPRKALISLESTRYYHVMSRCVRRAFLCGDDQISGNNYDYRRDWIEARIHLLSSIFAIDICAYAVMSNHYHIVLRLSPESIEPLSDRDIANRWRSLFKGSLLFQKYCSDKVLQAYEQETVDQEIAVYRQRLSDLGWFMKCINEPLARLANKEDNCKGHFWEQRYKSQALCSEEAILSCMTYVDLNPIRAKLAKTPETSDNTSIKQRLNTLTGRPTIDFKKAATDQYNQGFLQVADLNQKPLLGFKSNTKEQAYHLPCSQMAYIELVDWTGRAIREDKAGFIDANLPNILSRLDIDTEDWIANATRFESSYQRRFGKQISKVEKTANIG